MFTKNFDDYTSDAIPYKAKNSNDDQVVKEFNFEGENID